MDWFGGESLFTPFLETKEEIGDLRESEKNKTEVYAKRQAGYIVLLHGCLLVRGLVYLPSGCGAGASR